MPRRFLRLPSLALIAVATVLSFSCAAPSYQTRPMPADIGVGPSPEKCRIFVARSGQMTGSVRDIEIRVGGATIAKLGSQDYLCWDSLPNQNVVQVIYNGPKFDGKPVEDVLSYEGKPGTTYYFRLHLDPKTKKAIVEEIGPEAGQQMIASRKPAQVK